MDRRLIIACNKFAFEALVVVSVCLLATSLALSGVAHGDEYPSRTITLVAPSTPGSAPDVLARIVAHQLSEQLGQQVVVLNRPGAGTNIGTASVAQAEPDGYTLLLGSIANTLNLHTTPAYASPSGGLLWRERPHAHSSMSGETNHSWRQ